MKKLAGLGLLVALALAIGSVPARAVDQDDINRAILKGVAALRHMQGADGTWPHNHLGATALAGLTLLECGAATDDKAVLRAAEVVRKGSVALKHTYSISLAILFLDRLGDAGDVPLIESLMVRLLAGQDGAGGWTYDCPPISDTEVRRLNAVLAKRKEEPGRREAPKPEAAKRTVKDLPAEIQQQLTLIDRLAAAGRAQGMASDNSNTQFAALALWVGRRHGLPVERALARLEMRFRRSQAADGGWGYLHFLLQTDGPEGMVSLGDASTASMTCAGLLGLAVADGALLEITKERKPGAKPVRDVGKDPHLVKGLLALSTAIGNPANLRLKPFDEAGRNPSERVGGRTYYFLWSLERVAVALDLQTIGKKDWYHWGAEILLLNQQRDGGWHGEYSEGGADTCFALLFLKRANLARDLTAHLKGKLADPGERSLRAGGVGGDGLRGKGRLKSGIESKDAKPITKPLQDVKPADSESARLAGDLVKASGSRQGELLDQMRDGKGVKYTEALAESIPRLDGEPRRKARQALADRLTRMKADTLVNYLEDEDAEIRRAAALACAMKEHKALVPNLIRLLRDSETPVVRAAHAALKDLTGQDFGPAAAATREERDRTVRKWFEWWSKQRK